MLLAHSDCDLLLVDEYDKEFESILVKDSGNVFDRDLVERV